MDIIMKIELLRKQLSHLVKVREDLKNDDVLHLSEELDVLINTFTREVMETRKHEKQEKMRG